MAEPLSSDRLEQLTSWDSGWSDLRVLVVGLGETGFAMVDTLVELDCQVNVVADDALPERRALAEMIGAKVALSTDSYHRPYFDENPPDLVIVSPGIKEGYPMVVEAQNLGIEVWSDLELAWRIRDKSGVIAEWIMVLDSPESNLVLDISQEILFRSGQLSRVVGFEAPPVLDALRDQQTYQCLQISVAADSLVWRERFPRSQISPQVTVSLSDQNQSPEGVFYDGTSSACVYRRGAGPTEQQVRLAEVNAGARAIGVGLDSPGMSDLGIVEGIFVDRAFLDNRANEALEIVTTQELSRFGWRVPEQATTVLSAVAIARSRGVSPAEIAEVLANPHDTWIDKTLSGAP